MTGNYTATYTDEAPVLTTGVDGSAASLHVPTCTTTAVQGPTTTVPEHEVDLNFKVKNITECSCKVVSIFRCSH